MTAVEPGKPRRVYIRASVELVKYGYTPMCAGCSAARDGKPPASHTETCRARIEEEMKKEDAEKERLEKAQQRKEVFDAQPGSKKRRVPLTFDISDEAMTQVDGGAASSHFGSDAAAGGGRQKRKAEEPSDDPRLPDEEAPDSGGAASSSLGAQQAQGEVKDAAMGADSAEVMGSLEDDWHRRRVASWLCALSAVHVSEVFNPGRFTRHCNRYGLTPGHAFDLTLCDPDDGQPWDMNVPDKRVKAHWIIEKEEPWLLIGSPMCKAFSKLMALNWSRMDPEQAKVLIKECVDHLKWSFQLYEMQRRRGKFFLHEQPWGAWSWHFDFVQELMQKPDVLYVKGAQCPFGQWSVDMEGWGLVEKETGWLTNSQSIADKVGVPCSNKVPGAVKHRHVHLVGGRASATEVYPKKLVWSILEGLVEQLRILGVLEDGAIGPVMEEMPALQSQDAPEDWQWTSEDGVFIDDVTGHELDPVLVRAARAGEIDYIYKQQVYVKVPYETAMERTGSPPFKVRWVDINKGDVINPKYRSRLVVQEYRWHEHRDDVFAATPPLEALKFMLALMVTKLPEDEPDDDIVLIFMDVSRAHFHSPSRREVYVELCDEDNSPGQCARLEKSMYGTRDAASNWEQFYSNSMKEGGMVAGQYSPCLFRHDKLNVRTWVHGDDFVGRAPRKQARWLEQHLMQRMDIRVTGILGFGP